MNKELNILYIAHVSTMLGANRSLLNLLSGLKSTVKFSIIAPQEGPFTEELNRRNIPYHIVDFKHVCVQRYSPVKNSLLYLPRLWRTNFINARAITQINKELNLKDFNIIHSNSGIISIGQLLSKKAKIPHVWHLREFQDLDYDLEYISGKDEYLKILDEADAAVAISKSIADHFNIKNKVTVIYNGLFNGHQHHNKVHDADDEYFLFCGALIFDKGIEDAIITFSRIIKQYPSLKLKIAGEFDKPDYRTKILNLVNELDLNNSVHFLGFQNDLTRLMQNSIALFMCSHNEGLGRVTLEAMYNNCLVIGFNNAGTSELIAHKNNGLLYENLEEFENQILFSLSNPAICTDIKKNAYSFVMENFTEKIYADRILNVYKGVIND
jgi:glycosyltransferase involved in cell wall biosynthesis